MEGVLPKKRSVRIGKPSLGDMAKQSKASSCSLRFAARIRSGRETQASNPFAAAEFHFDVEREANVFLGVGVHVVEKEVHVGGLVVDVPCGHDADRQEPAEMNHVAAVQH